MPSWANAQRRRSMAGAYSCFSASAVSMLVRPMIGSTSTWTRMAVVPAAMAMSRTRQERLVEVDVRLDQARRDDAAADVDALVRRRAHARLVGQEFRDAAVGDRDVDQ